jgi:hypothetical protein
MVGHCSVGATISPNPNAGLLGQSWSREHGQASDYMSSIDEFGPSYAFEYVRPTALVDIFVSGAGAAAQARQSRQSLGIVWLCGGIADDLVMAREWAARRSSDLIPTKPEERFCAFGGAPPRWRREGQPGRP